MGLFSWVKRRVSAEESPEAVAKFAMACSLNIRRALGSLGNEDKIDDVAELLINPVAIGYIYGAPLKFAEQFLPSIYPERVEAFIDYSLQAVFSNDALAKLKDRFVALCGEQDQDVLKGVSLATRDLQAVVSAWANGIDPSELPECYTISSFSRQ